MLHRCTPGWPNAWLAGWASPLGPAKQKPDLNQAGFGKTARLVSQDAQLMAKAEMMANVKIMANA
jgi:hypothetical protein